MSEYYKLDPQILEGTSGNATGNHLHIKIKKREYIQVFRVTSYTRKIKIIGRKRKFIRQYKIKFNRELRNDFPFKWYGRKVKYVS